MRNMGPTRVQAGAESSVPVFFWAARFSTPSLQVSRPVDAVRSSLTASSLEILVDVVDVVLQGSGIDEKFLGVSLFALVPNTTEFMNAMSFALSGNIALR